MTLTNLKTVKSRIICVKKEMKKTTESGIILAHGQSSDEDQWATIIAVGPDVTKDIAVGDRIVPVWSTVGVITEGKMQYFVVDESNVLCVSK